MFNLEDRIRAWRQTLMFDLGVSQPAVDELESHLRDDVERHIAIGKTPDAAWAAAVTKLGEPRELAAEFAKTPADAADASPGAAWLPARLMVWGWVACVVLMAGLFAYSITTNWAVFDVLLGVHVFAVTAGYLATLTVGGMAMLATGARAIGRFGPREADGFRRLGSRVAAGAVVLIAAAIVLGAAWLRVRHGTFANGDVREFGGLFALGWTGAMFACLHRRRAVSVTSAILAGLVGNVVIALAWFGSGLISAFTTTTGHWLAPVIGAFVAAQLAFVVAAMQPAGWAARWRKVA